MYLSQLSADIKIKNCKLTISFVSTEGPKDCSNKNVINSMFFILTFVANCLYTMLYMIFSMA